MHPMRKKSGIAIVPVEGQIYRSVLEISVTGKSPKIHLTVNNYPEDYLDKVDEAAYIEMPECHDLMQKVLNFIRMEMANSQNCMPTAISHREN
jgi:hypothetical protein